MRRLLVLLLLLFATNSFGQMDLKGFQDLPWGVGPKEIKDKFAESIRELPTRFKGAGIYVDLTIPDYEVSGVNFNVRFVMDEKTDKLVRVILGYQDKKNGFPSLRGNFDSLEQVLTQIYGEPKYRNDNKTKGFLATDTLERSWVTPTTTIKLSYVYTNGLQNRILIFYEPTKSKDTQKL